MPKQDKGKGKETEKKATALDFRASRQQARRQAGKLNKRRTKIQWEDTEDPFVQQTFNKETGWSTTKKVKRLPSLTWAEHQVNSFNLKDQVVRGCYF